MKVSASPTHGGASGYVFVDARSTMPLGGTVNVGGLPDAYSSVNILSKVVAAVCPMAVASGSMLERRGVANMQ